MTKIYRNEKSFEFNFEGINVKMNLSSWNDRWKHIHYYVYFNKNLIGQLKIVSLIDKIFDVEDEYVLPFESNELDSNSIISFGTRDYYTYLENNFNKEEKEKWFNLMNDLCNYWDDDNDIWINDDLILKERRQYLMNECSVARFRNIIYRLYTGKIPQSNYKLDITHKENNKHLIHLSCEWNSTFRDNLKIIVGENGSGKTKFLCDIYKEMNDIDTNIEINSTWQEGQKIEKAILYTFSPFDNLEEEIYQSLNELDKSSFTKIKNNIINPDKINKFDFSSLADWKFGSIDTQDTWKSTLDEMKIEFKDNIKLSSGQKVFLYTIYTILNEIESNTLFLFDEIELFLHPTFSKSLISKISDILSDFNSIGIITTHSSNILQEFTNNNIFLLEESEFKQIEFNTFGEYKDNIDEYIFKNPYYEASFYKKLKSKTFSNRDIEKLGSLALIIYSMGDENDW